jgi:hypothetical protein
MNKAEPIEDDVIYAYAVEPIHDLATLERYLRRYPQFAQGLIDCSIELDGAQTQGDSSTSITAASAAVWNQFEKAMGMVQSLPASPFGNLDSRAFRALAAELNMNVLLLMRLRDRAIRATTIPKQLVEMLARKLVVSPDSMDAYLRGLPTLAVSGVQFKSSAKPTAASQIDFAEAVRTSQLSDEQQKLLLALEA